MHVTFLVNIIHNTGYMLVEGCVPRVRAVFINIKLLERWTCPLLCVNMPENANPAWRRKRETPYNLAIYHAACNADNIVEKSQAKKSGVKARRLSAVKMIPKVIFN